MDAGRPPLAARPKLTAPSATSSATSQARSGCGPVAISGPQLLGQVALEKDEHGGDSKIAVKFLIRVSARKAALERCVGKVHGSASSAGVCAICCDVAPSDSTARRWLRKCTGHVAWPLPPTELCRSVSWCQLAVYRRCRLLRVGSGLILLECWALHSRVLPEVMKAHMGEVALFALLTAVR